MQEAQVVQPSCKYQNRLKSRCRCKRKEPYHKLYICDPQPSKPPCAERGLGFVTSNSSHRTMTISRVRAASTPFLRARAPHRRSTVSAAGGVPLGGRAGRTNRRSKSPHRPHGARYLTCLRTPKHAIHTPSHKRAHLTPHVSKIHPPPPPDFMYFSIGIEADRDRLHFSPTSAKPPLVKPSSHSCQATLRAAPPSNAAGRPRLTNIMTPVCVACTIRYLYCLCFPLPHRQLSRAPVER